MSTLTFTPNVYDPEVVPAGKNGLSSFAAYYQGLLYKELIYPPYLFKPLDTWYDKQYYGKVDNLQNSIIPKQSKLRGIEAAVKPNLLALDFVATQFDAFASHMKNAKVIGVCVGTGNPKIFNPKAHEAYNNPMEPYTNFLNTVFETFSQQTERYTAEIRDFPSFADMYLRHLKFISPYLPVTLSSYMLTGTMSIFNTGLCISIDTAQFDDDEYKYEKYLSDPNFNFYVKAAKSFGFTVNKNAPWLLTADLCSTSADSTFSIPDMSAQLAPGGGFCPDRIAIDKDLFFKLYFRRTCLLDIDILQQYIVNCYATYIARTPYYQKRITKPGCDVFGVENMERPAATEQDRQLLTPKRMCNFYLDLRSAETKEAVHLETVRSALDSIYFVRPLPDLDGTLNVVTYINNIYRDYIYSVHYPYLNSELFNTFKTLDSAVENRYHISTSTSDPPELFAGDEPGI